jgi:hypothetical protein
VAVDASSVRRAANSEWRLANSDLLEWLLAMTGAATMESGSDW